MSTPLFSRIRVPEVEVVVLSWGYEDTYVSGLISELQPIGKQGPPFEEIERAEYQA